jgi:hypothetical protein
VQRVPREVARVSLDLGELGHGVGGVEVLRC